MSLVFLKEGDVSVIYLKFNYFFSPKNYELKFQKKKEKEEEVGSFKFKQTKDLNFKEAKMILNENKTISILHIINTVQIYNSHLFF
jgi:hypothetical protein